MGACIQGDVGGLEFVEIAADVSMGFGRNPCGRSLGPATNQRRERFCSFKLIKCAVLKKHFLVFVTAVLTLPVMAQEPAQPKVKVNMLNVCSPSADEQKEIAAALARIPKQPLFGSDFEVDRGQTSLDEPAGFLQPAANTQISADRDSAAWVRIRHEFSVQALFSTVQYSFSQDARNMVETLMFRVREPKDLLQVSIEDSASSVTSAEVMLSTNTPVSRVKLERFGKSSIVLARCPATEGNPPPDQSAYEPLFQTAAGLVATYRKLLAAQIIVPDELARVTASGERRKAAAKAAAKTPAKPSTARNK